MQIDRSTGCISSSPLSKIDCSAAVFEVYQAASCSGTALPFSLVGLPGNACASASQAECSAYFRALDCGQCATKAAHPNIAFLSGAESTQLQGSAAESGPGLWCKPGTSGSCGRRRAPAALPDIPRRRLLSVLDERRMPVAERRVAVFANVSLSPSAPVQLRRVWPADDVPLLFTTRRSSVSISNRSEPLAIGDDSDVTASLAAAESLQLRPHRRSLAAAGRRLLAAASRRLLWHAGPQHRFAGRSQCSPQQLSTRCQVRKGIQYSMIVCAETCAQTCVRTCVLTCVQACLQRFQTDTYGRVCMRRRDMKCIGHKYIGHDYEGHNEIGHS